MSLTYKEFVDCALELKNHSDSIDDDWNICEHKSPMSGNTIIYLVKKKMQKFKKTPLASNQSEFYEDEHIYPVMCEYHILYNPSYSCPDMFFNIWYTDGKLMSLEDIWSVVHSFFKQNIEQDKWNFITQTEHLLNRKPFFRIHPCQNTHVLEMLGFSSNNMYKYNPLITWLSTINSFIGLELHESYGHINSIIEIT